MNRQPKCAFDPNELRVLRDGYEQAIDVLGLTCADIADLSALAIAVFGVLRGVDLDESERVESIHCESAAKFGALGKIRIWISVASNEHTEGSHGRCVKSTQSRVIMRTASLKTQHPGWLAKNNAVPVIRRRL